jgi:hypothetical protein
MPFSCMASMASARCCGDGGTGGVAAFAELAGAAAAFDSPQAPSTDSAGSAIAATVPFLRKSRRESAPALRTSDFISLSKCDGLYVFGESSQAVVKPGWRFREESFISDSRHLAFTDGMLRLAPVPQQGAEPTMEPA